MSEDNTRDIAVEANTKVNSHIDDCIRFRGQLARQYDQTQASIAELADRFAVMQIKVAVALGVLISAGKVIDWILELHK